MNGRVALGRDRADLAHHRVVLLFEVLDAVLVAAAAVPLLASAPEAAARHAQPQVLSQVALLAVRERLRLQRLHLLLNQVLSVRADLQVELPLAHLALEVR